MYFYDSVPVIFFNKDGEVVMAVEYFVISEPSGGCYPIRIGAKKGATLQRGYFQEMEYSTRTYLKGIR